MVPAGYMLCFSEWLRANDLQSKVKIGQCPTPSPAVFAERHNCTDGCVLV